MRRLLLAVVACVAALGLRANRLAVVAHDVGGGDPTPGPSAFVSHTPCVGGFAGIYPCRNVDLLAFMPLAMIGGGDNAADLWGWTDPLTGKEYALLGRSNGSTFVDISDPEQPVYLGNLPTQTVDSLWREIKVFGNYALVVSEAPAHGMQVFDLTQLRAVASPPVTFTGNAHYAGFGNCHNIVVNEASGFAYAVGTNTCAGGLHMINLQNPLSPVFAGCFSADGYTHDAQCVVYAGPDAQYAGHDICFASNEDTLTIVDTSNKNAPVQLSRTAYAGRGYTHQGWLTDDHAYFLLDDEFDEMNGHHNTRTYVWDVSDLDAPAVIGTYTAANPAIDHNQFVRDGFVFQANYRSGLRILDLADVAAANLTEAAFFDIYPPDDSPSFNAAWGNYPFFPSGVVVISGIEQGLFIVQPQLGAAAPTPTATPTATAPSATATPGFAVSGAIRYYSTASPVNGAKVNLEGPAALVRLTNAAGEFAFNGVGQGDWRIEPRKLGGVGSGVSALDAVYVLQAVVGLRSLDSHQQLACDVSGNAGLSALDAALILQYKVGLISDFPVAQACGSDWLFAPQPLSVPNQQSTPPLVAPGTCVNGSIAFQPLASSAAAQDFSAVLFGDCTGNWQPAAGAGGGALSATLAATSAVRVGQPWRRGRAGVLLPVFVDSHEPFHALEVQLRHDQRLRVQGVHRLQGAQAAVMRFNASAPGLVRIALASAEPIRTSSRPLLLVQFAGRDLAAAARVRAIPETGVGDE